MYYAIIKTTLETTHQWKECNIKEVDFLKYPHHHEFQIEVKIQEVHSERDIEFISFKRWLDNKLRSLKIVNHSCESMSELIRNIVVEEYPGRDIKVSVFEDGHYGATIDLSNELAWMAGIIDGEGYIILNSNSSGHNTIVYTSSIGVGNTDIRLMETFIKNYQIVMNKKLTLYKESRKGNLKNLTRISINKQEDIKNFLTLIIPYLVNKKERAELLLQFVKSRIEKVKKFKNHKNCNYSKKEKDIASKIKELNKKGK